jgi:hypothetical protein
MPILNINTDAVVKHTARLERMHRSALPVAIRGALNKTAFDVKKNTMPAEAKKAFIQRKPTFLKATSKVEPAKGFDIRTMKSTVGFAGNSQAVEDLEMQEGGGQIGGRAYIPLKQARAGGNWKKNVRAAVRISDIKNRIVDSRNAKGKNNAQKFTKSAIHAGKGGFVIGNRKKGNGNKTLFQIRSIKRIGRDTVIKSVPLFSVKRGKKVSPKPTHFMERASVESAADMERHYIAEAKKQIDKLR